MPFYSSIPVFTVSFSTDLVVLNMLWVYPYLKYSNMELN